jgi:8-oxo-dGTP pyrophosphatase MutT (NUDIX family)
MVLEFGTWAIIIAITPQQEVILIRQYRHGVGKVIWEIPGGVVDPGETPLQAAGRELLEETGYRAATIIETGVVSPNPDNHTNFMHTFLALDVVKASEQDLDDSEEIDIHPIPLNEVIRMALDGEILQAMHISALFFALAHLKRIS